MIIYENFREHSIGAKAYRLFVMREKGINVPELVCAKSTDELKDFPFDRNGLYSVRSSADCEDGASMSFAGQFMTTLNVKGTELEKYTEECLRSAEEAGDYLRSMGAEAEKAGDGSSSVAQNRLPGKSRCGKAPFMVFELMVYL